METDQGTPQGGIISPTLCNVALNGLEELILKSNPNKRINGKRNISRGVHVIRYADDMVLTGKSEEIILKNKEILARFLSERGLELNETKTKITHIKDGFDFLGFNIRRCSYKPRLNKPTDQETVLIIKPSKKGVDKLKTSLRTKINKNIPMERIIGDVNPILRGWGEHKRISYHSQETFITIDH